MTSKNQQIELRLQLGEDSEWEFKQIRFDENRLIHPKPRELAKAIVAFANARGGNLLCSIAHDDKRKSIPNPQYTHTSQRQKERPQLEEFHKLEELSKIVKYISAQEINPPIEILLHHISTRGKQFLMVEIPKGQALHIGPGGAYVRSGTSNKKISHDELLRLTQKQELAHFHWFDQQPVPGTDFQTLDRNLWKPLLSAKDAQDPESGLERIQLLAPDEYGVVKATVAGILTCSEHPGQWLPNASIYAVHYQGNNQASDQLDAKIFDGSVNSQIEGVLSFARRNMQVAVRKKPDRTDVPQYSEKALFEAVVNAIAHRDYSIKGSQTRFLMFDDRLEIRSPGSLPKNLTLESMPKRQVTRNETLVSVLCRMHPRDVISSEDRSFFMRRRGDGVRIIQHETQKLSGKPPRYRLVDNSELHLTIPAASLEVTLAPVVITTHHGDRPLPGVDILALFPNHTWKQAVTDEQGEAALDLHSTHLPMTLFAAVDGCSAHLERAWMPAGRALAIELKPLPAGGSVIFSEATGHIPGLTGRLNPILDAHGRTYLYASNIAINQGQPQPVYFQPGEDLRLTDANGKEKLVRIVDIQGRSVLLEYRPFQKN